MREIGPPCASAPRRKPRQGRENRRAVGQICPSGRISSSQCWQRLSSPGYKIALFLHILAVVLAFGPTFGYALFFLRGLPVPAGDAGDPRRIQRCDRYLVNPGMIVLLLAGFYLLAEGPWKGSEAFIGVGIAAILVLFGLQHGFFGPQVRKAKELAERDLQAGDTLSDEFEAVGLRIGQVGTLAGIIIVVTIFFMAYKPF